MAQASKKSGKKHRRSLSPSRPSLFDYVEDAEREAPANKFCEKSVLIDEASVEQFFVNRLIEDLEYADAEIRPKRSLDELPVARGRKKENYRPDYVLYIDRPRWLIDAKSPDESVDYWAYQGAGYAHALNKQFKGENPCQYYVITNGYQLKVWKWDEDEPILDLSFADFFDDNSKYIQLKNLLGAPLVRKGWIVKESKPDIFILRKPAVEEMKRAFKACHDLIWKAEKLNPQPAFFEFVKIMFVKLLEDKKLHDDPELGRLIKEGQPIPRDSVIFSTHWIESLESKGVDSPVDTVLFHHLVDILRDAVRKGDKKPIFEDDEHINLHAGTIKQVVAKLETLDMLGIDDDLNGRLFETFLSATMRGQALGQYFTPRSIVKLMERLAAPVANRDKVDRVMDGCCGTGGFLIEVLADMLSQVRNNTSLSSSDAKRLERVIANESIYGIDAGKEPPLARIARINMYLHGDGGSRIYAADSLDKSVTTALDESLQAKQELEELRELLMAIAEDPEKGFDSVLSNPPFSMGYSDNLPSEKEILDQYDLATFGFEGTSRRRPSLRSSVMFIERYADLLKPGGKLITVIDDSVLASPKNSYARDFIRERFIIRAVISLPGDAFYRVGARVKTSILYLVKREEGETGQPAAFMYECQHVGLDDVPMKTRPSVALEKRQQAEAEMNEVIKVFKAFMSGKKGTWLVPGDLLTGRLDVKSCLPRSTSVEDVWSEKQYEVVKLGDIVDPIEGEGFNPRATPDKSYSLLRIRYDGIAEEGDKALGTDLTYNYVQQPKENDIVAGNITAVMGSICVIPADLTEAIASSEFTIMRLKDKRFHPWFLWAFLRSTEIRARLLSQSRGMNRHRIDWDLLKTIPVPVVPKDVQKKIGEQLRKTVEMARKAERDKQKATQELTDLLDLENEWAVSRLKAAKPPR
jgi:type I restriction enzyme M protein